MTVLIIEQLNRYITINGLRIRCRRIPVGNACRINTPAQIRGNGKRATGGKVVIGSNNFSGIRKAGHSPSAVINFSVDNLILKATLETIRQMENYAKDIMKSDGGAFFRIGCDNYVWFVDATDTIIVENKTITERFLKLDGRRTNIPAHYIDKYNLQKLIQIAQTQTANP